MKCTTQNDFSSVKEICLHLIEHLSGQPIFLSAMPQVD